MVPIGPVTVQLLAQQQLQPKVQEPVDVSRMLYILEDLVPLRYQAANLSTKYTGKSAEICVIADTQKYHGQ